MSQSEQALFEGLWFTMVTEPEQSPRIYMFEGNGYAIFATSWRREGKSYMRATLYDTLAGDIGKVLFQAKARANSTYAGGVADCLDWLAANKGVKYCAKCHGTGFVESRESRRRCPECGAKGMVTA
jgi:DnaJ-class molecular chaperone